MGLVVGGPELWGMMETEQRLGDSQWRGIDAGLSMVTGKRTAFRCHREGLGAATE